jgi:hypothetical protein
LHDKKTERYVIVVTKVENKKLEAILILTEGHTSDLLNLENFANLVCDFYAIFMRFLCVFTRFFAFLPLILRFSQAGTVLHTTQGMMTISWAV